MASKKISAMPSAASFEVVDYFPIVKALNNYKCTRDVFLTMTAGEYIQIGNASASIYMDDSPYLEVAVGGGGEMYFTRAGFQAFGVNTSGSITIAAPAGQQISIGSSGGSVVTKSTGIVEVKSAGGNSSYVSYKFSSALVWAGSSPIDMADAITRIATAVAGLLGGPIP